MTTLETPAAHIKPLVPSVQVDTPLGAALAVIPAQQPLAVLETPLSPAEPLSLKRFIAPVAAAGTSLVSIGMALSSGSAIAGVLVIGATAVAAGITLVNELTRRAPGAELVRAVQSERAALAKREAALADGIKELASAKVDQKKARMVGGVDVTAPAHLESIRAETEALTSTQIAAIADGIEAIYTQQSARQYYRFVAETYTRNAAGTEHQTIEFNHVLAKLTMAGVVYAGPVTLYGSTWLMRATDGHAITSVAQLQNYLRVAGVLTDDAKSAR